MECKWPVLCVGDEQILSGATSVYRRIVFSRRSGCHSALRRVLSKGVFVDIKDFLRMFAYDYWANRECLAAMRAAEPVSPDTVGRMAHILSAQKLWLERILKQRQSMPVWPTSTIDDCVALADEMSSAWRSYLMHFNDAVCDPAWDAPPSRLARRPSRIPQQQGPSLVQPCRGRADARTFSLGVSSRADRFADARVRHGARLHRFHPCRAPGIRDRVRKNSSEQRWIVERYGTSGCRWLWACGLSALYFSRCRGGTGWRNGSDCCSVWSASAA